MSDGLVEPLNVPPGTTTPVGVQAGVSQAVVTANTLIVFGTSGGIFVYSGTPGFGNPPIFYVSGGTTDPYGNPITPTVGLSGLGQFNAGNMIINIHGIFLYSGTPAANNLIGSQTIAAGTDLFGNAYLQGQYSYFQGTSQWTAIGNQSVTGGAQFAWYYTSGLTETGWIAGGSISFAAGAVSPTGTPLEYQANGQGLLIGAATPEEVTLNGSVQLQGLAGIPNNKTGFMVLFANSLAKPTVEDVSNLTRSVTRSVGSATSNAAGNNATATALSQVFSIAPDLAAGDLVEISLSFNATMGQTTAETFALGYSLNGGGQVTLATIGAAITALSGTFTGNVKLCMRIAQVGASGTVRLWLEGGIFVTTSATILPTTTATIASTVATGVTFNTTIENTLALWGTWGGAGGSSQVFTAEGSTMKIF